MNITSRKQNEKLVALLISIGVLILVIAALLWYRIIIPHGDKAEVKTTSSTIDVIYSADAFSGGDEIKSDLSGPKNSEISSSSKSSSASEKLFISSIPIYKNQFKNNRTDNASNNSDSDVDITPQIGPSLKGVNGEPSGKSTISQNYELAGRELLSICEIKDSKEEGVVVVNFIVDKEGTVIEADPNGRGTTTSSTILKAKARQAVLCAKFSPSAEYEKQAGIITLKFDF